MDDAFKDPKYKEARELVNAGNSVRVTAEDTFDYADHLGIRDANEYYKRESQIQIIDSIEDLRLFAKYIDRLGLTITKIEVVE